MSCICYEYQCFFSRVGRVIVDRLEKRALCIIDFLHLFSGILTKNMCNILPL